MVVDVITKPVAVGLDLPDAAVMGTTLELTINLISDRDVVIEGGTVELVRTALIGTIPAGLPVPAVPRVSMPEVIALLWPVTVTVTVTASLRHLVEVWRGDVSWEAALRSGTVEVHGPGAARRTLPRWFSSSPFAAVPRAG